MSHSFARSSFFLACLTLALGSRGAARAQEGPFVYAPMFGLGLETVDAPTNTVGAISLPTYGGNQDEPVGVAVSPDESKVYVADDGTTNAMFSVVNTATGAVTDVTSNVLQPYGSIAVTPNGATVYLTGYDRDLGADAVVAVNTTTNALTTFAISTSETSQNLAMAPDGSTLYVASGNGYITPIDVATNTVKTSISLGLGTATAYGVVVAPDGNTVYATAESASGGYVVAINTKTNTVVATMQVSGSSVIAMAISPDGRTLYVGGSPFAGGQTAIITVIDTTDDKVINTIHLSGYQQLSGLTISPDGQTLYAAMDNNAYGAGVVPIDLANNDAVGSLLSYSEYGSTNYNLTICSNGNALLASGLKFVANTSGALACTGSAGPVFTGGTLQFAGANISSSLPILLQSQGGIFDTDGNNATLSGAITGTGGLTKIGQGILTLSGPGSYSGPTFVAVGTLQAGATNAFSRYSDYTIAAGAVLDLNNYDQTIGSLAGAGAVTLGSATLTAGVDNASTIFSGDVSGSGGLTKAGSGALFLSGTNDYTGATTILAGTLIVDGSIAQSTTIVQTGALLGGKGAVGSLAVLSGGTVAPGAETPYTTLTVAGNASFSAGSIYAVNVNAAGQTDALSVGGSASLSGGTVDVAAAGGLYTPLSRFTLLTAANGVSGSFDQLQVSANLAQEFAFLTPTLSYDADHVYLGFAQTVSFASVATTRNQAATAAALQALGVGDPLYAAVVGQNVAGARQAFDAMSGEVFASATTAAYEDSRLPREAVLDRLSEPFGASSPEASSGMTASYPPPARRADPFASSPTGPVFGVWGRNFGEWGVNRGDGNAATLSRATGGFILGEDAQVSGLAGGDWRFGAAEGFTSDDFGVAQRASSGDLQTMFGALYVGARFAALDLRAGAIYGFNALTADRQIAFPGFAQVEQANANGSTAQVFGEAGYRFDLSGAALAHARLRSATLEPFVGAAGVSLHADAFSESGGSAALNGLARDNTVATTTLGLRAETALADPLPLVLRGLIGWRRAYGDLTPTALLAFQNQTQPFVVAGAPIDRNALVAEAGVSYPIAAAVSVGLSYSGQYGPRATDNAVKGSLEVSF